TIIGSTTVSANSAATAASIALPPASSISAPAAEASGWFDTIMPFEPIAGCFSHAKCATRFIPLVPADAGTKFFGPVLGPWIPAFAGISGEWFDRSCRDLVGIVLDEARTHFRELLGQRGAGLLRAETWIALADARPVDLVIFVRHADLRALEARRAES